MMRGLILCTAALGMCCSSLLADHVIVTGGPALRKWEDLRVAADRHDRWWANFVRASTVRIDQLIKPNRPEGRIIWMVYQPAYRDRGKEDGKPYPTWIEELAAKRKVQLMWFSSGEDFVRKFNQLPRHSVRELEYFGHSNKYAFMFEYGSDILAASTAWLHQDELGSMRASVFHPEAICTSWGCHTGESMSEVWERVLKVPLRGVVGPTNYSMVGQAQLPTPKGPWSR